jgi:hypothetical protein
MGTEKEKLYKILNPEKYKMITCPSCRSTGKSSNKNKEVKVCRQCGGFRFIKREKDYK